MKHPATYDEVLMTTIKAVLKPLISEAELDRATAAAIRRKRNLGLVALQEGQGGIDLIGNYFAYRLALAEGWEKVPSVVFKKDEYIPPEFPELLDAYHFKLTPPMEKAKLVAAIVDSGFVDRTELARVLGTPKSMTSQLYNLWKLPADVKKDSIADCTLTQTDLFEITRLPGNQQSSEYWKRKNLIIDRQQNPASKSHHEVHKACELMIRAAGTITRVLAKHGNCFNSLNAQQRGELCTAEKTLADALSNLRSFTATNSLKRFLRSLVR